MPPVESVAVAKVLPVLVSVIAPFVVVAFSAAAWIAPVWLMVPPPESVRLPPTFALATINACAS